MYLDPSIPQDFATAKAPAASQLLSLPHAYLLNGAVPQARHTGPPGFRLTVPFAWMLFPRHLPTSLSFCSSVCVIRAFPTPHHPFEYDWLLYRLKHKTQSG